jgi:hypothetical protein
MKKLLLALYLLPIIATAKPLIQESYFVFDKDKTTLSYLVSQYDLVIDHMSEMGYEVYGPFGLSKWLDHLKLDYQDISKINKWGRGDWPRHDEITKQLQKLAKKYPDLIHLFSIGQSSQGRELWMVKISDNVRINEREPEFKYIANMHGDEIVGRDLMVLFIEDLAKNYNKNRRITDLINNTEIYIMPTMNPDGSEKQTRANANWIDLNRDFPDFTTNDNANTLEGRAIETRHIMKFQAEHHFSLSANFHGGAIVVNYPWDTSAEHPPLQNLIEEISLSYANPNETMSSSRRFEHGIVNGHAWYEVNGGMQDWSYYYHNDLQVTVELSQSKWPSYRHLDNFYEENRESCLAYLEKIHQGGGFYLNDQSSGTVTIRENGGHLETLGPYTYWGGEFYKVLPNGNYTFEITKADGNQVDLNVVIDRKEIKNHMVAL